MPRRNDDSPNWGGPRPGAGRKPTTGKTVVTKAFSLPTELVEWLQAEAERREVSQSKLVASALESIRAET